MKLKRYLALLFLILIVFNMLCLSTVAIDVRSSPVLNLTRVNLEANDYCTMHIQVSNVADYLVDSGRFECIYAPFEYKFNVVTMMDEAYDLYMMN